MPVPIPWSQLEGPCTTAWWWPEATKRMKPHKHHFLVALIGGSIEPVERRVILTKVISSVVRDTDAVGIYWGEGTLVHEPSQFVQQAESVSAENIPGPLWIDVRVENTPEGSLCFTTGMASLGFLEIEVEKSDLILQACRELWRRITTIVLIWDLPAPSISPESSHWPTPDLPQKAAARKVGRSGSGLRNRSFRMSVPAQAGDR